MENFSGEIKRIDVILEELRTDIEELRQDFKELYSAVNSLNIELERLKTQATAKYEEITRELSEIHEQRERSFKKTTTLAITIATIISAGIQVITFLLTR